MTTHDWLTTSVAKLNASGDDTARLDALILLEDSLQTDRALLLAHPESELTNEQQIDLDTSLRRRLSHEPLAYIRGHAEFYGRVFSVNKNVLVPRPESETMIELLKNLPATERQTIIDVGTGSGALAITAKLGLPTSNLWATDIDPECLTVAEQNAKSLGADITFLQGDLLAPLLTADIWSQGDVSILCNLPYVPENYPINRAAEHEPRLALFAGDDGLDLYRSLFTQIDQLSQKPSNILAESLPEQHDALYLIAAAHGYKLQTTDDFIQVFKLSF